MGKNFLAVILSVSVLLSGCDTNAGTVDLKVNETSAEITETTNEVIDMNNCGGKGDVTQTAERSKTIHVEYAGEFGIDKVVVSGEVSAKYGEVNSTAKKMELIAPAGTNMKFVVEWTEKTWLGFVTAQGKNGEAEYKVSAPISVSLISSQDLGCNGTTNIDSSQEQQNTSVTQEIPTTPEEAAVKWGGQPEWWEMVYSNGWKVRGQITLNVGKDWRADYTSPNGEIKSCGDTIEPGVYGGTTISVTEATLWYVPGETECPSWSIWAQSRP